jgi:potassium efflux system protein
MLRCLNRTINSSQDHLYRWYEPRQNTAIQNMKPIIRIIFIISLIYSLPGWSISEEAPFKDLVHRWNNTLDADEAVVSQPGIEGQLLNPVLESVRVIKESAKLNRSEAKQKLARQRNLLNSLGDIPEKNTPPESAEIIEKRKSLGEEVTKYDGIVKQCNLVLIRANVLLDQISEIKRQQVARALYEPTPLPLAPSFITLAISQIPVQIERLLLVYSNWYENNIQGRYKFIGVVSIPFALVGWLLISTLVSRIIRSRYGWSLEKTDPNPNQKFLAVLNECLGQIVLPIVFIVPCSWLVYKLIGIEPTLGSILPTIIFGLVNFVLIRGLSKVALVPRFPQFRISHFTDQSAKSLSRAIYALAISGLVIEVIMVLSIGSSSNALDIPQIGAIEAPEELTSLVVIISLLISAVLLFSALRDQNWRFVGLETDPDTDRHLSPLYRFVFYIARFLLATCVVLALIGYLNFGLFVLIRTAWLLGAIAMIRLTHGFIAALFTEITSQDNRFGAYVCSLMGLTTIGSERGVFWVTIFFDVILISILVPVALILFGIPWDDLRPAIISFTTEFQVGSRTFSLLGFGGAIISLIALLIGIRLFQQFMSTRLLVQTGLDIGVRNAISSGIGYIGMGVLIFFTLSMLGLQAKELALIFGALSVGIGFGLQHIINNFISGLVLLIQRPIKPGDWIVVGDQEGYVKQVNVITTEIQTFDNAALIVPNGDLVSSPVVNWMHKSKLGRVIIPIGVSYSSNPEQVSELLLKCARENTDALVNPAPNVIFKDFGESALLFELRFFIRDMDYYWRSSSAARFMIKNEFDNAGIEIPFPQRVVKVRNNETNIGEKESTQDTKNS